VEAGFGVVLLSREAEVGVGAVPGCVAPDGGCCVAREVSGSGVDEFGGCVGEVADDGIELVVDRVLCRVCGRGVVEVLGEGLPGFGVVGPGSGRGSCGGGCRLCEEVVAVPGVGDGGDECAVVAVVGFAGSAAEWVELTRV